MFFFFGFLNIFEVVSRNSVYERFQVSASNSISKRAVLTKGRVCFAIQPVLH